MRNRKWLTFSEWLVNAWLTVSAFSLAARQSIKAAAAGLSSLSKTNSRAWQIALALLVVGAYRHYGWAFAAPELRGLASKALGAMATLALLWIVAGLIKSAVVTIAATLWSFGETQTVVCTTWYALDPWPVAVGQSMCSAKVGIDLGAIGIMFVAFALRWLLSVQPTNLDSFSCNKK